MLLPFGRDPLQKRLLPFGRDPFYAGFLRDVATLLRVCLFEAINRSPHELTMNGWRAL